MTPRRLRQPGTLALAVLALAVLAFYARALPRYFTSEDFLLLRFLREHPPWESLREFLTSPWLGISVVKFYRPASTLVLAVEAQAFGAWPIGYNAVHLTIHILNALLVWRIARRIAGTPGPSWTPLAIALLFALYPLHPNTVSFIASFATLVSSTFLLLSLDAYQRRADGLSLAAFLLALGSYESAVVLPGLLVAQDLLLRDQDPAAHLSARARARRWAPFGLSLLAYLMVRRAVLGVAVGGYEEASRRLFAPRLAVWARDFSLSVWWLHIPRFERAPSATASAILVTLLVVFPLALCLTLWKSAGDGRRWLLGWIWVALSLLPFAFAPVVPGSGRYWYFASIGLAMTVCFLARWLSPSQGAWRHLALVTVAALGAFWMTALAGYVRIYVDAGRTARRIQQQIQHIHAQAPNAALLFVTNYPLFLRNATQTPLAQVYHYGLADAVHPPFSAERVTAYPLPVLTDLELAAVAHGRPQAPIARWDAAAQELRLCDLSADEGVAELESLAPVEGATLDRAGLEVAVRAVAGATAYRLLIVAEGNDTEITVGSDVSVDGVVRVAMPGDFVATMGHLYGSEMFWWIEARDANRVLLAASRMRGFRFVD